jgi:hypothetical protein
MPPVPRPGDSSTRSEQASASASIGASNGPFFKFNGATAAGIETTGLIYCPVGAGQTETRDAGQNHQRRSAHRGRDCSQYDEPNTRGIRGYMRDRENDGDFCGAPDLCYPLLGFLKLIQKNKHPTRFGNGGPTLSRSFVGHFPPKLRQMKESASNNGISRCHRGALALHSLSAAQPKGGGRAG